MKRIYVIHGPNLNMLGIREPEIYGTQTYADLLDYIDTEATIAGMEVSFFQSNHEGALIDFIQDAYKKADGIIINPGAYAHTSIAIADAVRSVGIPTAEVHLTDITAREPYRRKSYLQEAAVITISGLGFEGYKKAIDELKKY